MKFSEITYITDLDARLNVGVAGSSRLKFDAVRGAISRLGLWGDIERIAIPSTNVDEQPVGRVEIIRGAEIRAKLAEESKPQQDIYFGIENGIEESKQDYAIIVATLGNGKARFVGSSRRCLFPTEAVIATQNLSGGFKQNTVGKYMESQGLVKKHDDPHIDLCGRSRLEILEDAIFMVLAQIFPKMLG